MPPYNQTSFNYLIISNCIAGTGISLDIFPAIDSRIPGGVDFKSTLLDELAEFPFRVFNATAFSICCRFGNAYEGPIRLISE